MMNINAGSGIHVGPPGSTAVPPEYLDPINRALTILSRGMRNDAGCNTSFTNLSGGKTFKTFFDDPTVWINYDPTNNGDLWGWTIPSTHPKDIVITKYALRMGRWSTAATIVHELAHLNGAPGGASHAAELRVKQCRMQSTLGPYDPNVVG